MYFGKYCFSIIFLNNAVLPPYKGSLVRGVLGDSLKNIVCAKNVVPCEQCKLRKECIYAKMFETHLFKGPPETRQNNSPPPFVIEPPVNFKTHFKKNEIFDFHLLLFGDINLNFPYFIYAFEQLGKTGIGKNNDGKRGKFILQSVTINDIVLYSDRTQYLKDINLLEELTISPITENFNYESILKISFETPLRFKVDNRLSSELSFEKLIRIMLRRISSLLTFYGKGNPDIDYKGILQRAKSIKIIDNDLSWNDWRRYSARQKRKVNIGGLMGTIIYKGKIKEFLPFIEFCSEVHIGKQTTFGLGKFTWKIID